MNTDVTGVYLLHFDNPFSHARHYTGMAKNIRKRVNKHADGKSGVGLMNAIKKANIGFQLARIWECDDIKQAYMLEHKLKRAGGKSKYCPLCTSTPRNIRPTKQ